MGMGKPKYVDYFLGTTGPAGFVGYFDTLADEDERQLYLIKSGPGCGKSTMMRRVGEATGGLVERIHCSSDPDSLDGVVLHETGAAVVDATAPHTLEPEAPAAREQVVSLYHTLNEDILREQRAEIEALFAQNAALRGRAGRYLSSASGLLLDSRRAAACSTDFEKVHAYAKRLATRLLPKTGGTASEERRFLSGITPKGLLFFSDTVRTLAPRQVLVLQDEYGAASRVILQTLREEALARGHHIVSCACALHPEDKLEHLLLPELGLAVLTSNSWHPIRLPGQRNIHCRRFADNAHLHGFASRLRFNRKAARELLEQAVALMARAKAVHDQLETFYTAAVDFDAVDTAGKALLADLGLAAGE